MRINYWTLFSNLKLRDAALEEGFDAAPCIAPKSAMSKPKPMAKQKTPKQQLESAPQLQF